MSFQMFSDSKRWDRFQVMVRVARVLSMLFVIPMLVACRLPKRDKFDLPDATETVNRLDAEGNVLVVTTSDPANEQPPHVDLAAEAESVAPRATRMESTFPDADSLIPDEIDLPLAAKVVPPAAPPITTGSTVAAVLQNEQEKADKFKVAVSGVEPNQGPVRVAVFTSPNQFPNHQNASTKSVLPSSATTISGEIEGIPPGVVALAVYQDLNNDGELNRSSFGIPSEPYGFSNDARGQMGPPNFADAQVQVGQNSPVIPISLTKLKF